MKGNGSMTRLKVKAYTCTMTEPFTMAAGRTTSRTALEKKSGQMGHLMKGTITWESSRGRAGSTGQMEAPSKAIS